MITVRKAEDRGHAQQGWLDTYHTFSFADYHDPRFMGFRQLRVINDDRVAPGQGFAPHSHSDMEILTCVLEGQIEHQDSLGNKTVITAGEVQRMSAGTGVTHSEYNPSTKDRLHLLQIWILPENKGLKPGYEQKSFPDRDKKNQWRLVACSNPREGSLKIHQDVELFIAALEASRELEFIIRPNRHVWVQITRGALRMNGHLLKEGDGAAVSGENLLKFKAEKTSEILLFNLA